MAIPFELVRVLNSMEGDIAEAAKQVIQQQQHPKSASRSQFKLAVESAQQAKDSLTLKAFLAYQASRDKEVWGHKRDNQLFVQRAWTQMGDQIDALEIKANSDASEVWRRASDNDKKALRRMVAERFFAHIERAFEIWKDKDDTVRRFYFDLPQQEETTVALPVEGGAQGGD